MDKNIDVEVLRRSYINLYKKYAALESRLIFEQSKAKIFEEENKYLKQKLMEKESEIHG